MIAFLEGNVLAVEENALVVLQAGIGLRVFVTAGQARQALPGQRVALYTHLVVREDLLALYGFEHQDER